MKNNQFPKLQLKKSTVAKLSKDEMQNLMGGEKLTVNISCGTACHTATQPCHIWLQGGGVPTQDFCQSADTNGGGQTCEPVTNCGSDDSPSCVGAC